MKTVGLITEYNPFHKGHAWHMQEAKRVSGADYCIIVMSGNFVQRGAPAILDKYARTEMALSCGADLVLELPVPYATGSAEYFAMGAVSLLEGTGVTDALCFGSECGDLTQLNTLAETLLLEPLSYQQALKAFLKQGENFPKARALALEEYSKESGIVLSPELLKQPNNILGIEYLKALLHFQSSICPLTIPRIGGAYHQDTLDEHLSSASAIRRLLDAPAKLFANIPDPVSLLQPLKEEVPDTVFSILEREFGKTCPVSIRSFSSILHYRLLQFSSSDELTIFQDITPELADRIFSKIPFYEDFTQFVQLLHTRQYTDTRISRCLIHILLDLRKADISRRTALGWNQYLRVLGFRKDSSALLGQIKEQGTLPLITKLADAQKLLDESSFSFLQKDISSSQIYQTAVTSLYSHKAYNEYTKQLIIR